MSSQQLKRPIFKHPGSVVTATLVLCVIGFYSLSNVLADSLDDDIIVENFAINQPLTATPGDPERGLATLVHRQKGNCLGCHHVPIEAEFFGTTGPSLAGVGARLPIGMLRLRLVDSKQINPSSMMPAYYKADGLHRVMQDFEGKTILSAQDIEDVIAYLATLTTMP